MRCGGKGAPPHRRSVGCMFELGDREPRHRRRSLTYVVNWLAGRAIAGRAPRGGHEPGVKLHSTVTWTGMS